MALKIALRLIPDWGTTYGPPGEGPFPAIMILHGSEGAWSGWSHRTAVILAAHGFLAFPFGYSKGGNWWNAGNIIDVPLDRTVEALAALRDFPESRHLRRLPRRGACLTGSVSMGGALGRGSCGPCRHASLRRDKRARRCRPAAAVDSRCRGMDGAVHRFAPAARAGRLSRCRYRSHARDRQSGTTRVFLIRTS